MSEAVAYREPAMHRMLADAGLAVVFQESGSWTGRPGLAYQDTIVAQRSVDIEESA